ncbi:hypothetical protein JRQ81_012254, partial [Phrynocephalus forsythii]
SDACAREGLKWKDSLSDYVYTLRWDWLDAPSKWQVKSRYPVGIWSPPVNATNPPLLLCAPFLLLSAIFRSHQIDNSQ